MDLPVGVNMALKFGVKTDVGRKRTNNEDSYRIIDDRRIFVIADGMGGHRGGEVASSIAVRMVCEHLQDIAKPIEENDLREALYAANSRIFQTALKDPSLYRMGTTAIVTVIRENKTLIGHVGDSRVYRLRDGELERITTDHSLVFQLVSEGKLTETEAKEHPNRNALLRAIGVDRSVEVDCIVLDDIGERLLMCTDGLTEMVEEDSIKAILETHDDPQEACDNLVTLANENGGIDNTTVILIAH
jgi:protein phosphatase